MKKIANRWTKAYSPLAGSVLYVWGYCRVLVENHGGEIGWHLSISCQNRYPTWDEIKHARYDLLPADITMAMLLPPADEYVNLHKNCFHLHQISNEEPRDKIIL